MTDQQLLISTVREAGQIIADHLEAGGPSVGMKFAIFFSWSHLASKFQKPGNCQY
jgi:hypothetical protein